MSTFSEYATRYDCLRMERSENGILQLTLHHDGGPMRWSLAVQGELGWVEVARTLRLAGTGIATEVEVDEAGSALLAGCTGEHTLDQLSAVLAPLGVDREAVLASATELLLRGVLRLTR